MFRGSSVGVVVLAAGCVSNPPPEPVWVDPTTEVKTWDATGAQTDGQYVPSPFGGSVDVPAELLAQDPEPQDPEQQAAERRRREAMIRATFGNAVSIGADGRVTKIFPLSQASGNVFLSLVRPWEQSDPRASFGTQGGSGAATYGGPGQTTTVLDRLLGDEHPVDVVYLPNFDAVRDFKVPVKPNEIASIGGTGETGSLVIVTALPSSLAAFQRALDLFYVNIPQIEIEVKVVEYSTTDTLNFGVSQTGDPMNPDPTFQSLNSGTLVQEITSDFPLTAPFIGATSVSDQGIIRLGGIHDSWELNAVLQALETNAIADVLSQPKLVVRNGGTATVQTSTELPFPKARISTTGNVVESQVEFKDVGIVMTIKPEVAGTDTVTLLVHASVSAATGFAATEPIPTPIIARRAATTSVHLREGETMVIGGLVSNATLDSEAKFPLLGDIPIIGYLFRSTSKQVSKTVLEFHITPTIIRTSGG